jgi:SOS-response transcriptional repressor LexA
MNEKKSNNLGYKKATRVEKTGFSQRLTLALDKAGFPPINRGRIQRLAEMMDLSHRGAGKWLDGETTPPAKKCPVLADKLNVDTGWLVSGKGNMVRECSVTDEKISTTSTREIPLYSVDELKNPYRMPAQTITCYVACVGNAYALKVDTEALSPRFSLGTILIFDAGKVPKDGDFVLAQTAHFPTPQFRQLSMTKQGKSLEAINPKFDRIYMNTSDKILGVVVQAVSFY